ncbi:hypothetical protein EYF80_014545 [Liparis tanakae]|uniref:Uncharacterized protein n=1 Tax=Liparis tanakae TaxID=230148 RepID=A0A4Z2ICD8_9TELE|nr:hypothetical protein EYF80_014545 [Liparis tanakae]
MRDWTRNTGDWNLGDWDRNNRDIGDWIQNTGDWGIRDWIGNTGDWNIRDWIRNMGDWDIGDCSMQVAPMILPADEPTAEVNWLIELQMEPVFCYESRNRSCLRTIYPLPIYTGKAASGIPEKHLGHLL